MKIFFHRRAESSQIGAQIFFQPPNFFGSIKRPVRVQNKQKPLLKIQNETQKIHFGLTISWYKEKSKNGSFQFFCKSFSSKSTKTVLFQYCCCRDFAERLRILVKQSISVRRTHSSLHSYHNIILKIISDHVLSEIVTQKLCTCCIIVR